jgi:hypothetical protein
MGGHIFILYCIAAFMLQSSSGPNPPADKSYPLHASIICTIFWVGEGAGDDGVSNIASAWDDEWVQHYGGVDDPVKRKGYYPAAFTPKENPFYCALPYNDFLHGKRKANAARIIPWAGEKVWGEKESLCKNRWVEITKGKKTAYAQWEDVGPFNTDDGEYVFGKAKPPRHGGQSAGLKPAGGQESAGGLPSQPANQQNSRAGIDVSPAVRDFLKLEDIDKVSWRFVEFAEVPPGPWRAIVTSSSITWR